MKKILGYEKIIKILTVLIGIIILLIGFLNNFSNTKIVAIFVLIILVELIALNRKNQMLTIFFSIMLYFNYSIIYAEYLNIIENTIFTSLSQSYAANIGIYILMLFWLAILVLVRNNNTYISQKEEKKNIFINEKSNAISKLITFFLYFLLAMIFLFGFTRPENLGDRGSPSAIYEYSLIILILCFFIGNKYRDCKFISQMFLFLFVIQNFIFGGRITGIQLLLAWYIMCINYKINFKKIIPAVLVGIAFLTIIGETRGAWTEGNINYKEIFNKTVDRGCALDTAYSSYHTSLTFVLCKSQLSLGERIDFLLYYIKYIFLGGKFLGEYNLPYYTRNYYVHYYGGVLPFYFYFYLGWLGVLLIAIYIYLFIKISSNININSSGYKKCLIVYFISSSPRWFLYSPSQITRGIIILTILFFGIEMLSKNKENSENILKKETLIKSNV